VVTGNYTRNVRCNREKSTKEAKDAWGKERKQRGEAVLKPMHRKRKGAKQKGGNRKQGPSASRTKSTGKRTHKGESRGGKRREKGGDRRRGELKESTYQELVVSEAVPSAGEVRGKKCQYEGRIVRRLWPQLRPDQRETGIPS